MRIQYKFIVSLLRVIQTFQETSLCNYLLITIFFLSKKDFNESHENSIYCFACFAKKFFLPSSKIANLKKRKKKKNEESFSSRGDCNDDDSPTVYHGQDLFPLEHVLTPCARTRVATDIVVRVVGTCNVWISNAPYPQLNSDNMFCFGRGEPPSRSLERGSVNQGPFPSGILHRWITAPSVNLTLYTPIRRVHDNNFSGKSRQTAASPVRFEIPRVGSRDSLITIDEDDPLSSMIFFLQVTLEKKREF